MQQQFNKKNHTIKCIPAKQVWR